MKKTLLTILLCLSTIAFASCSNIDEGSSSTANSNADTTATTTAETQADDTKDTVDSAQTDANENPTEDENAPSEDTTNVLVAYFSYSGNTKTIAEKINAQVDGDLFEIDTTYDYPREYNDVLDYAQQEKSENARPELSNTVENIDEYDVVFVGFPNWWGDMPMVVYSFLETYDLSNKTVVPFVTSSSSGFSNTISAITNAQPNATIAEGLSIYDSSINNSDEDIKTWLTSLGF